MATDVSAALGQVEHALGITDAFADIRGTQWARVRGWSEWNGYERNGAGLYVPAAMKLSRYPTGIDLFAGCGGMSLGFHQAGIHVVAALEWDVHAAMSYLVNLGDPTTRIYPDPERKAALIKANNAERKRAGKVRTVVVDGRQTQWMASPGSITKDGREKGALEHPPFVDHGEYLTWPGAGQGWIRSARLKREGVLPNPPDYGSDYVRELNTVDEKACLEACQALFLADARQLTGHDILTALGAQPDEIDIVCGGPPCQGFSTAGKKNVYDSRNSLVFDFVRILCDIKPKTWVMENVPNMGQMVTPDGELVVDAICRMAEQGGMGVADNLRQMLETTAGVGVAQRGVRRKGEERPEGETRAERRRRLREERKAAKREAKATVAGGADEMLYLQDDLFAETTR